eukprot:953301-Rhodomonas_salina.1
MRCPAPTWAMRVGGGREGGSSVAGGRAREQGVLYPLSLCVRARAVRRLGLRGYGCEAWD